jgi:hypothetical protein
MRSSWRLWVVLAVQLLIVAAVPGKKLLAFFSQVEITLETEPYDPYDVLSGYYVTLRYAAETPPPGTVSEGLEAGEPAWILLRKGSPAWTVVSVTGFRPTPAADEAALAASWDGRSARLDNLRNFYISEAVRGDGLVDLRVGANGEAVLLRMHVADKTFGSAR